jgi:WhiB family redox-sensing transcriptional regulator
MAELAEDVNVVTPLGLPGAACSQGVDPEIFYAPSHFERKPEKDLREGIAKAVCRRCIAIDKCLSRSLEHGETYGIWGGLNELERRQILRRRAIRTQAS